VSHTVLVVEDEEELRETMRDALELSGYAVVAVADGQEALERLDALDELCLVLLDLVMPRMNGWDFCAALRSRQQFASTPVVVHTTATLSPPAGATRVIRKPIELARLLAVVQEYCAA
jgi:CheY-like chemotaxis protein